MNGPSALGQPFGTLYRVVRRNWADPLDAGFSRRQTNNRWNTPDFAALYCCLSEKVARAVTLDLFRLAGLELSDLRPEVRPQLVELEWEGRCADMCGTASITAAGFPPDYPAGVRIGATQRAAAEWRESGFEGVLCRSASLARLGFSDWTPPHERWSEAAIFVETASHEPHLRARRDDFDWFILTHTA